MITKNQKRLKRGFDLILGLIFFIIVTPILILLWILASLDTKMNGLFTQVRVGLNGTFFTVYKIRTMKETPELKITSFGKFLRKTKLDELPQLLNIILGEMSFVGPRPDVKGYADKLEGDDSVILTIRPGITGPASLKYKNEEALLAKVENPKKYNDEVIWKDKVEINKKYISEWSFLNDLKYIVKSIF